jgi:mannosyltransferase OCH1-like enzyme
MIEKNIFQTFSEKTLPEEVQKLIETLKNNNPDYKYYFFDESDRRDFITTNYGKDICSAYDALQINAAKADFWRYLALYFYGGIYIDIDSCVNEPFDSFLLSTDKALITRESNKGKFVQWGMFFCKKHPVLEKLIKYVAFNVLHLKTNKITVHEPSELFRITGPGAYTNIIEEQYINDKEQDSVYDTADEILNTKTNISERADSARFLGIDYNGKCSFKHDYVDLLQKIPWTVSLQTTPLVKW